MSVEQENKALIRRYFEAIDTGKIEILDGFVAADFVDHSPFPGASADREGLKQAFIISQAATCIIALRHAVQRFVSNKPSSSPRPQRLDIIPLMT